MLSFDMQYGYIIQIELSYLPPPKMADLEKRP